VVEVTDPTQSRADFIASRQLGIGGSDLGSLLSDHLPVEYGCARKLWYRLSGYPPDSHEDATEPMLLGSLLEKYILRAYSSHTGRKVTQVGLQRHPTVPCLQYHDDGIADPAVDDSPAVKRVVECKGIGREMMAKVNSSGLVPDYIYQGQGGMAAHGLEVCDYAVGQREDLLPLVAIELTARIEGDPIPTLPRRPKLVTFPVERSPEIIGLIEDYAPKFWDTLRNEQKMPPRLDYQDTRCSRCRYRVTCQGQAIMEGVQPETSIPTRTDLSPLIQRYRNAVAIQSEAEELVTGIEDEFRQIFGGHTAFQVLVTIEKDGRFEQKWKNILYRLQKGRETVDGKRLVPQYDALRRAAIEAGVPGAELTPPSGKFIRTGLPVRPLRLSGLLPPKPKKAGDVPEVDGMDGGDDE
jgi:hypothetical protein